MKKRIINSMLIIPFVLFLAGCTVQDMNFTFDNKTNTEIDSVQVKINAHCPQCPQIETVRKISPYGKAKLTIVPFDDIKSDGEVSLILFYDSFKKEIFSAGPGYFSNGAFPSSTFGDDKLKYSIIERDTGLTIVNDWKEDYYNKNTMDVKHIGTEFNYMPDTNPSFQPKPFAKRKMDTLIITDYWVMPQKSALQAKANIHFITIKLTYLEMYNVYVENNETQTIEVVSKFVGVYPDVFIVEIDPFKNAGEPSDLEKEQGFRDAREFFKKIIYKTSTPGT